MKILQMEITVATKIKRKIIPKKISLKIMAINLKPRKITTVRTIRTSLKRIISITTTVAARKLRTDVFPQTMIMAALPTRYQIPVQSLMTVLCLTL